MTSPLITGYVSGLHRKLPAALAEEAAAGLLETTSTTSPAEPATTTPPAPR